MNLEDKTSFTDIIFEIEKDLSSNKFSELHLTNKYLLKLGNLHNQLINRNENSSLKELINQTIKSINNSDDSDINCIPVGFNDLDKVIGGFPMGEFIIIGGRPGIGKTSFMISCLAKLGINKTPTAYFSLENNNKNILIRLLNNFLEFPININSTKVLNDRELKLLTEKSKLIEETTITIEDKATYLNSIIAQIEFLVKDRAVKVVFIDYIQIIQTHNSKYMNRELEISLICRELKTIARKHNICIVASSQLSRSVETRGGDKKPQLNDLRESGAIEQDADKVIFIYRPEYYGIIEFYNGKSTIGKAELIIAKNRSGPTETVMMEFVKEFGMFKNNTIQNLSIFNSIRQDELI